MSRQLPNILISGTPGVGKSSLASLLAEKTGLTWINVGEYAKEHGCLGEWDEEYQTHNLEEDKLLDILEERQKIGGIIIDHHMTDIYPERWFDIVFVLRANNTALFDRLSTRGYTGKKLEDNLQCEIFQTVLDEAKEAYREELVHELQSNTAEEREENLNRILAWINQWQEDRGKIGKMASAEALQKLETRAVAAEKLISLLKLQIAEAKEQQKGGATSSGELETLKSENLNLKQEVEAWKVKLTQAEIANGKSVFNKPGSASSNPPATEQQKSVEEKKKTAGDSVTAEKKEKPKKEAKPAKEDGNEPPVDVGRLDMRVGHIRSAKKHPDADSLYIEEVDVGEEKPRTVISGLVKFIPEPEMQDRMAIILCNLKPSKMRGIMSEAMVMCASTPEKVEILSPPAGCKPGDHVLVDGYVRNPDTQLNPKKKIFETCAPDLTVNSSKEACFKGVKWTVNGEAVTSQTLVNVAVK